MEYKVFNITEFAGIAPGQFTEKGKRRFARALEEAINEMVRSGWRFEDKIGPMGQYLIFSRAPKDEKE